jgi:hypothetical protein
MPVLHYEKQEWQQAMFMHDKHNQKLSIKFDLAISSSNPTVIVKCEFDVATNCEMKK